MKKILPLVLKIILALPMVVFGANKLFGFMPMPEPANAEVAAVMAAIGGSYLGTLLGLTEIIGGILLFVKERLGLLVLLPVTLNIVVFHLVHDPAGSAVGVIVFAINVYLIFKNKEALQPILD